MMIKILAIVAGCALAGCLVQSVLLLRLSTQIERLKVETTAVAEKQKEHGLQIIRLQMSDQTHDIWFRRLETTGRTAADAADIY